MIDVRISDVSRMFLAESNWSFQLMQFCPFVTFAEAILGSELITRLFVLLAHDNRKMSNRNRYFTFPFICGDQFIWSFWKWEFWVIFGGWVKETDCVQSHWPEWSFRRLRVFQRFFDLGSCLGLAWEGKRQRVFEFKVQMALWLKFRGLEADWN